MKKYSNAILWVVLSFMLASYTLVSAQSTAFIEDWETGTDGWNGTIATQDDGSGSNTIGVVTETNKPNYSFTELANVDQLVFELRYSSDLAATYDHIDLRSSDGMFFRIATNNSNRFEIKDGSNSNPIAGTDLTLAADQWYNLKFTYTPATNHVVFYIDDVEKANFTSVQTATSSFNRIGITQYVTHTTRVDDISLTYSSLANITAFTLAEQTGDAVISTADTSITIEVAFGSDLTNLTPSITLSENCTIAPNSGVAQDYSSPVNYTVTHADGSTKTWEVTITEGAEPMDPRMVFFEDWESGIDGWNGTVTTAGDGSGTNTVGIVTGTNKPNHSFTELSDIDQLVFEARYSSDLTATYDHLDLRSSAGMYLRIATNNSNRFEIKDGSNSNPIVGTDAVLEADVWYDLKLTYTPSTNQVVFYVDGVEKANFTSVQTATSSFNRVDITQYVAHTIRVDDLKISYSSPSEITAFTLVEQTGDALISGADTSITIEVANGSDLTNLVPTISISENCTVEPNSGIAQDFTNPLSYTVTHTDGSVKTWNVTVNEAPGLSPNADILSFTLPGQVGSTSINMADTSIAIDMHIGTDLTALLPEITFSSEASIAPLSGVAQNFSGDVEYTVTAEDGSKKIWTVSVSILDPVEVNFFDDFEDGNLDGWNISSAVIANLITDGELGSTVVRLTPTASAGNGFENTFATASAFGKPWSIEYQYKLDAIASWPHVEINSWPNRLRLSPDVGSSGIFRWQIEPNGVQNSNTALEAGIWYNVKVIVDPEVKSVALFLDGVKILEDTVENANMLDSIGYFASSIYGTGTTVYFDNIKSTFYRETATEILNVYLPEQSTEPLISASEKKVTIHVPYNTDLSSLTPEITTNPGASLSPDPSIARDYSTPQSFIVTSKSGSVSTAWTIEVIVDENHEAEIVTFSLPEQTSPAVINNYYASVNIEVAHGTDRSSLTPDILISPGATRDPLPGTSMDFTDPTVIYITSESGTNTRRWAIRVHEADPLSSEAEILDFNIPGIESTASVNTEDTTVWVHVELGTELSALTPEISISENAIITPANGLIQDFTAPVEYTVTAEDGTLKTWTVTIGFMEAVVVNFFDDFEDGNLDGWSIATTQLSTELVTDDALESTVVRLTPTEGVANGFGNYFESPSEFGAPWMLEYQYKLEAMASWPHIEINTWPNRFRISPGLNDGNVLRHQIEPNGTEVSDVRLEANQWYNYKVLVDPASGIVNIFLNDEKVIEDTVTNANMLDSIGYFGHSVYGTDTRAYFDNVKSTFYRAHAAEIINAYVPNQLNSSTLSSTEKTVTIILPFGYDVSNLTPELTVNPGATISPAPSIPRNYDTPQIFEVSSADGSVTNEWTVDVVFTENTQADILSFTLDEAIDEAVINHEDTSVTVVVAAGTDVTSLSPSIAVSTGAEINPPSEVSQDFSQPVIYTVTAENGAIKAWEVNVTRAPYSGTEISSFTIDGQVGTSDIDAENHTIEVVMPSGSDLSALLPNASLSEGAGISPELGLTTDFSTSVTYTVTAESGAEQDWEVRVSTEALSGHAILSFTISGQVGETQLNAATHSIVVTMPAGTDVTALIPSITLSEGATITPRGGSAMDFTAALELTVTAENGTTSTWVVTIELEGASSLTEVEQMISIYPNPVSEYLTIETEHTLHIEIHEMNGKLILLEKRFNSHQLDVSDFKPGRYMLICTDIVTQTKQVKQLIIK